MLFSVHLPPAAGQRTASWNVSGFNMDIDTVVRCCTEDNPAGVTMHDHHRVYSQHVTGRGVENACVRIAGRLARRSRLFRPGASLACLVAP